MKFSRGLIAGCIALACVGASAVMAAPLAAAVGIAVPLVALSCVAVALAVSLFAPQPFRLLDGTPRSIFETRRAGLA